MDKKLHFITLICMLLNVIAVSSQEPVNGGSLSSFEASLQNAGLTKDVINKIHVLVIKKNESVSKNQKLQAELDSKYLINFKDDEIEAEYANKKFIKSLSETISIEQFRKIFQPQLEYRIKRISDEKWDLNMVKYKFNKEQEKKYKNLLYQNTVNEIIVREYYSYDDNLSWNNYTEEKLKSSNKEFELIKSFCLLYSKNAKTDSLIKKLTEAKVDNDRINQILAALQDLDFRNDMRLKTWRENDAANMFNFHDPGDDEYPIYLEFREKLSKILKIEEFKTAFLSQMQKRIVRDSEKEFNTIKANYSLSDVQYSEIQKLVLEKNTEKIVTEEYYKYNYELYQQKLRAVEYRHEKGMRETIQKFNVSKS